MKIILSRKGFDSCNGKTPSPIIDGKTLLSMPIPMKSNVYYSDLYYQEYSYQDILTQLHPKETKTFEGTCHLDPDIRNDIREIPVENWHAAFGQISAAQGYLQNCEVGSGDLFLFFGWFRDAELYNNKWRYKRGSKPKQIVYGYMQVKEVVKVDDFKKYNWHPHTSMTGKNNVLYIPEDKLSFDKTKPGYGVLTYNEKRVLTLEGKSSAIWKKVDCLTPDKIIGATRKNSCKQSEGLYYAGIWQEMVFEGSTELNPTIETWAENIIR